VRFIEETTLQDEATAAIIRLNALSADMVLGNVVLEVDARTALVVDMGGRSHFLATPQRVDELLHHFTSHYWFCSPFLSLDKARKAVWSRGN
jgi:hypothetical protein